ncbi:MAG: hypothetical protein CMH30_09535 [Micavibrio sp.]|nr:hypothetical protein [Micavibrio sp.]|tara:strand:- start:2388 stop:3083 length:696 start_codon:yes stop_codon:yes gene_type:complete
MQVKRKEKLRAQIILSDSIQKIWGALFYEYAYVNANVSVLVNWEKLEINRETIAIGSFDSFVCACIKHNSLESVFISEADFADKSVIGFTDGPSVEDIVFVKEKLSSLPDVLNVLLPVSYAKIWEAFMFYRQLPKIINIFDKRSNIIPEWFERKIRSFNIALNYFEIEELSELQPKTTYYRDYKRTIDYYDTVLLKKHSISYLSNNKKEHFSSSTIKGKLLNISKFLEEYV